MPRGPGWSRGYRGGSLRERSGRIQRSRTSRRGKSSPGTDCASEIEQAARPLQPERTRGATGARVPARCTSPRTGRGRPESVVRASPRGWETRPVPFRIGARGDLTRFRSRLRFIHLHCGRGPTCPGGGVSVPTHKERSGCEVDDDRRFLQGNNSVRLRRTAYLALNGTRSPRLRITWGKLVHVPDADLRRVYLEGASVRRLHPAAA